MQKLTSQNLAFVFIKAAICTNSLTMNFGIRNKKEIPVDTDDDMYSNLTEFQPKVELESSVKLYLTG